MEVEVFEERQAQFFSGKDPANCYRAAFPHCCGPGAESGKEQLEQAVAAYQQALEVLNGDTAPAYQSIARAGLARTTKLRSPCYRLQTRAQ